MLVLKSPVPRWIHRQWVYVVVWLYEEGDIPPSFDLERYQKWERRHSWLISWCWEWLEGMVGVSRETMFIYALGLEPEIMLVGGKPRS